MSENSLKNDKLEEMPIDTEKGANLIKMLLAKKTFGIIGWGFFAFAIVSVLMQGVSAAIINIISKNNINSLPLSVTFLITFVPMYVIALPLLLFIIRKLPKFKIAPTSIPLIELIKYFCMCITIMYIGNLVGTGLSYIISSIFGKTPNNNLADLIGKADLFNTMLFMVILGPIMEEIVFRKILIDRTVDFGERNAMFLSALMFGLFHMNLFQFFYAFGIGLIFSFIYIKTKKIIYTIIFHVTINFLGSVGAIYTAKVFNEITKRASVQGVEGVIGAVKTSFIIATLYSVFVLATFIAGVLFLIINLITYIKTKKGGLDLSGAPFTKKEEKGLVYGNYGMALFIAVCLVMTVFSTIAQMQ